MKDHSGSSEHKLLPADSLYINREKNIKVSNGEAEGLLPFRLLPFRQWIFGRTALWTWVALVLWSLWLSGIGRDPVINRAGFGLIGQFWVAMFHPAVDGDFLRVIVDAAVTTLAFAVCGTALSLVVGMVGGVFCSQIWWQVCWPVRWSWAVGRCLWLMLRSLFAIPRAIHELIWGLLLLNVLGLDPMVGVLAIAIPFGAITAKVFSEILDETPTAPLNSLVNSGVRPSIAFVYGLLPQALPNLISYAFYRFECSLRAAAVLGIIGAGGLGFQIDLSLKSLQYEQLWTGFYALILLNGTVDLWSAQLRRQMGFVSRMDLTKARTPAPNPVAEHSRNPVAERSRSRLFIWLSWSAIAFAIPTSFAYLNIDWSRWGRAQVFLADIATQVTPDRVFPEFSFSLIPISLQTVAMSVLAITLAGLGGILFSFPAAQNFCLPGGLLNAAGEAKRWGFGHALMLLSRLVLLGARAIPAPILALVILYGMYPSILPGALALAIHNFGILGRLMAEVNENVPDGPVRALRSLGASSGGIIFYGILPANLSRFLAYGLYRWEVCLRETVIVGLVGAGGLGRLMKEQLTSFDYSALAATLSVFILLTIVVDWVSSHLRASVR